MSDASGLDWAKTDMEYDPHSIVLWPKDARFRRGDEVRISAEFVVEPDLWLREYHGLVGCIKDWRVIVEYVQKTEQFKERFRNVVALNNKRVDPIIVAGKYLIVGSRLC